MPEIYVDRQPKYLDRDVELREWWPADDVTVMALDTETSGLYVDNDWPDGPEARASAVSLAWLDPLDGRVRSLAFPFDQGRVHGKAGRWLVSEGRWELIEETKLGDWVCAWNLGQYAWDSFIEWLRDHPAKMVMHNAKFDLHIMKAGLRRVNHGIDLQNKVIWDTQLASGLIWPLESSGLKPTAKRLWGDDEGEARMAVDNARKKNGVGLTKRYDLVPWSILGPYAAKDAEQTIRLWKHQQRMITDGEIDTTIVKLIEGEITLAKLLYRMELKGIGFDAHGMRQDAEKMRKAVARIAGDLPWVAKGEGEATITGAKQWFFKDPNNILKQTPQGAPSLDAEVVRELANRGAEGAEEWQHLANMQSCLSKWYTAWPMKVGPDGRLRTNFRQGRTESDRPGQRTGGAISGRLSAERIQAQGVPQEWRIPDGIRGVKSFFRAATGHKLVEIDVSQAEVRVATWVSRCKGMANVLAEGTDVHGGVTRRMFGIEPDDKLWDEYRRIAKALTFGTLYGAGSETLRRTVQKETGKDFGRAKMEEFIAIYDNEFPEFRRTARAAERKADRSAGGCGYVRLVNGRKRVLGWSEYPRKAFNQIVQGGVAEAVKMWMLSVDYVCPGVLVNQVHDSLWLELHKKNDMHTVDHVIDIGMDIFEHLFSTPEIPIEFRFDVKDLTK